jgi:hypothetical protein
VEPGRARLHLIVEGLKDVEQDLSNVLAADLVRII